MPVFLMLNRNQHFNGTCEDYSYLGLGIVRHAGYVVFVRGMLKGESGEIVVTASKKTYGYGRLLKLTSASEHRTVPPCPYYPQCGGCQIMHLDYAEQLTFKQEQVAGDMQRIVRLEIPLEPIIPALEIYHYRNKVQIPIGIKDDQLIGGFYRYNSHDIIPMDECILQGDLSNEAYRQTRELIKHYDLGPIVRHVLIRQAFATNELMLVLIINQDELSHKTELIATLSKNPHIKSIIVNVNKRNDNVVLGDKEYTIYGQDQLTDILMDHRFNISSRSFYQVNTTQTSRLYQAAYDLAKIKQDETVLDLYCGIGTIGIIAASLAKQVIGIEIEPAAVKDAETNAKLNNLNNINFYCGDAGQLATELHKQGQNIDVVFVDPPRKGCDEQTIGAIVSYEPDRIIYISCNPATLARDIALFSDKGYATKVIQPVDMFPNTYHVECVVLMSRK